MPLPQALPLEGDIKPRHDTLEACVKCIGLAQWVAQTEGMHGGRAGVNKGPSLFVYITLPARRLRLYIACAVRVDRHTHLTPSLRSPTENHAGLPQRTRHTPSYGHGRRCLVT